MLASVILLGQLIPHLALLDNLKISLLSNRLYDHCPKCGNVKMFRVHFDYSSDKKTHTIRVSFWYSIDDAFNLFFRSVNSYDFR